MKEKMIIEDTLIKTIYDNGSKEILSDLGELALDNIIRNDAINQIPLIGLLKSLYKISTSISDYFFIQSLLKFLNELANLSKKEKENMKSKIENEDGYENKIGEKLLGIINKIDDSEKPAIIAKIFKSFINGFINRNEFFKFSQVVNKSYLPDLMKLTDFARRQSLTNENSSSLLGLGLIQIKLVFYSGENISRGLSETEPYEYTLNSDGKKLLMILYPEFEIT